VTAACGGRKFDDSSILVSSASLSFGLSSLNSFPSISRESWASFTPWPERGELPMTFVGSGDAKVYKDPELSRDDFGILSDEVNTSSPSSYLLIFLFRTSFFVHDFVP